MFQWLDFKPIICPKSLDPNDCVYLVNLGVVASYVKEKFGVHYFTGSFGRSSL